MLDLRNINPLIKQIAEEKDLPTEKVFEALENALAAAYKKEYGNKNQIIKCKINPETGEVQFFRAFWVVDKDNLKEDEEEQLDKSAEQKSEKFFEQAENVEEEGKEEKLLVRFNPERHILLEEAQKTNPQIKAGEEILILLEEKMDFSRIAAQTAKQVILQKLKEIEREIIINEFKEKEGKIISGTIQRIDRGNIYIDLRKTIGLMPVSEGIPGEHYRIGERKKFYILKLDERRSIPTVLLSRSHPKFVSKLFESEVPEIANGIVEIKAIAREPGSRTKIAVASNNENVDPVGACVGQKGTRIAVILDELKGEKIDVIPYSEEPAKYVSYALGPAKVEEAEVISDKREVRVFLQPDQLSLAIGKNGQNVRLAAKLTGWRIDIRSILNPTEKIENGEIGPEQEGNKEEIINEKSEVNETNKEENDLEQSQ